LKHALILPALLICFNCLSLPAHAQATTTCQSGQFDMLDMMTMDATDSQGHQLRGAYHMEGNANPIYTTLSGTNTSGKFYYVKSGSGHPWDINLYDQNYIYLWITERGGTAAEWNDAYAFKKFNYNNSDYTLPFVRRCVMPGDGITSNVQVPPPPTSSATSTNFQIHPATGDALTNTSADCTPNPQPPNNPGFSTSQLGWVVVDVFPLQTNVNLGGNLTSISMLPVSYRYNCASGTPADNTGESGGGCNDKEEFDFNNTYGFVQWTHWVWTGGTGGGWGNGSTIGTPAGHSVFNTLVANNGQGNPDFPCF
jgi:hypothetical protein